MASSAYISDNFNSLRTLSIAANDRGVNCGSLCGADTLRALYAGRLEEAEESLRQGAQTAKNPGDRLECLQYLADILAASGKYEKPYRIAAKIFFFVGQYEDAVSVFERARENGVAFGPELRLYEIKTRRKRKPSKEEHRKLLKDCQALAEELEKEAEPDGQNPDFRDSRPEAQRELLGEVCCTLGLLYWDEKKADAAVRAMADAIRISPAHKEYRMFLGEFYIRKENYWEKYKDTYRESDLEKALFYMTRQNLYAGQPVRGGN